MKLRLIRNSIILFFVLFFYSFSFCQSKQEDILLLKNKDYSIIISDNNYREQMYINNSSPIQFKRISFFAKNNPVSLSVKLSMLLYQKVVSPQLFRYCLYERSCSNFSKKAIEEFGLIKGIFLSADRLLRCNIIALEDVALFDEYGYAIDEPSFYKIK
jgi:putative component of membrane protein insertase Oxa1/YidC/SpoIIIJ protein YidD